MVVYPAGPSIMQLEGGRSAPRPLRAAVSSWLLAQGQWPRLASSSPVLNHVLGCPASLAPRIHPIWASGPRTKPSALWSLFHCLSAEGCPWATPVCVTSALNIGNYFLTRNSFSLPSLRLCINIAPWFFAHQLAHNINFSCFFLPPLKILHTV